MQPFFAKVRVYNSKNDYIGIHLVCHANDFMDASARFEAFVQGISVTQELQAYIEEVSTGRSAATHYTFNSEELRKQIAEYLLPKK